jgi:glycosyltransferase involved in cell wall biosynthesis
MPSRHTPPRTTLAILGGLTRPGPHQPHGTAQAAHATCQALARHGRYQAVHLYDDERTIGREGGSWQGPDLPPTSIFERGFLAASRTPYAAIYAANGDQMKRAPHLIRPAHDLAPVICSVGTTHNAAQWINLFVALASEAVRATDGLIFKSQAAQRLFRATWDDWCARFGLSGGFPCSVVIPNGVDVQANRRLPGVRERTRRQLRIADGELVFLAFSRLSPGTKGDQQALIVRWQEVLARNPNALLILAGAVVDAAFVAELRALARAAEVSHRVMILDEPYAVWPEARTQLMSAADVFVHLSTGMEEASPLVVSEAMAHALPVIATAWAGIPELVTPDKDGFLIATAAATLSPSLAATVLGQADLTLGLAASSLVSLDWGAFCAATAALGDRQRREAMGAAARAAAEARALPVMAARYVAFFEEACAAAERTFTAPAFVRPLMDLNAVLAAQAGAALDPQQRVRRGQVGRVPLLREGLATEAGARLELVLAALAAGPQSLGALAGALAAERPPLHGQSDFAAAARLLVRMLNYGIIEPA